MQQTSSGLFVAGSSFKKDPPPRPDKVFPWAGKDISIMQMPGGGAIQFDLNRLTMADYRSMRDHYQINASMAVLSFMVHQAEWQIKCSDKRIATAIEEALVPVWSRLVRAASQAYWAGYAPTIVEWKNDVQGRRVVPSKFKDLIPENARVHWKKVDGYAPRGTGQVKPKVHIYDGIDLHGVNYPIPVDNTFWYPLLMENGDYYGKKLLRPAFPSWFFSILIHLFANRYFERFGEPVPVGRADYEAEVMVNGQKVSGNKMMEQVLTSIRNRSVVVLPSDRVPVGDGSRSEYAYQVEYLESQMRGADFERYLDRLDEEMSLGLFTPVLLLRTADVGSYNLGVGHMQMYMWMLNALLADFADYINPYLVDRIKAINFSPKAADARLVFKPMGKQDAETMRALVQSLVGGGKAKPDIDELGQAVGMTLTEVRETTEEPADPNADPDDSEERTGLRGTDEPRATAKSISARMRATVDKAFTDGRIARGDFAPRMGMRGKMVDAMRIEGMGKDAAIQATSKLYSVMDAYTESALATGHFQSADAFMTSFEDLLNRKVEELAAN